MSAEIRHQRGSAGEILGRKLARSDPQSLVGGGSARWEPPAASRAPSFSAARHRPLCPRLRHGVLTARTSFSGACGLGRLRRCMPVRSAAFLNRLHYLNASGDESQDAKRSGSTLAPTCARKWKIANGASTIRRRCAARSPMFSRRPLSSLAGCSYPVVKRNK